MAIGPSGDIPKQNEKVTITAIDGKTVTLGEPLKYYHYGDPAVTIDKGAVGQLDMRAAVAHLNRNIKIVGKEE